MGVFTAMHILMGVGNEMLGDDGVGPYIAEHFTAPGWQSLSCGTAPENFTSVVRRAKADLVVIIDAAEMDLPPGTARLIREEDIEDVSIGTHQQSLSLLMAYMRDFVGGVILIGIQPESVVPGEPLSLSVRDRADEIMHLLRIGKVLAIPVFERD
jgi:hydrogenase 3 maturation protease